MLGMNETVPGMRTIDDGLQSRKEQLEETKEMAAKRAQGVLQGDMDIAGGIDFDLKHAGHVLYFS